MAAVQQTPLDELQWRSPAALANLYHFFGGLHRGTIHLYFAESDYMDRTSNNWALLIQNQGAPWLADRDAFEARLRTMQGLEFMVVAEPERKPDATDSGIYVLRKQNRRKRPGNHDDELTVLATYYVIGENIYQAASLEDIVGNKILAASTSLSKFFTLAASLPIYTSGRGYSYFPPSSTLPRPGGSASVSRRSSRAGSPLGGVEGSMLDSAAETASQTQDSSQPNGSQSQPNQPKKGGAAAGASAAAAATSLSALTHSIRLFTQYGSEFSDTNPLVGEPGSFVFSATARQVQASQAKAQAAAEAAAAAKNVVQSIEGGGVAKEGGTGTVTGTSKPPTPLPPLDAVVKPPRRVKRSKSKAGTAPTSPVTPSAATPGKGS
ncbi:MED6 mediator subfamily complex component-domain-containing protein [Phyllosticta paracitricarpa]|uniref:Mediator of RNA polymerase II transcription subunit 6 n=1 Tax=Phyllosticta paracitricarpa TaxID=2016321 RepID=A0ABR1MY92_9PEZI